MNELMTEFTNQQDTVKMITSTKIENYITKLIKLNHTNYAFFTRSPKNYIFFKLISKFEMGIKWGRSSTGLHPNL
jgi:hypothetical protein